MVALLMVRAAVFGLLGLLAAPLLLVATVLIGFALFGDNDSLALPGGVCLILGVAGRSIRQAARRGRYASLEELEAAAAAGVPRAMRAKAMYCKLQGDFDEAERLLRAAVDKGDVESMWEMGRLVEDRQDLEAAEPWFRMAAEHGHVFAKRFFRPGHALNLDGKNPL